MATKRSKNSDERKSRGRTRDEALFPVAPDKQELPDDYSKVLSLIKDRIQQERLRVVMAANAAMTLLYWDIGKMILERQKEAGWGAKIIDRLAFDLRSSFPEQKGFSPRNLKYMRSFAASWPDRSIVQEVLAQITWYQNIALLEKLKPLKIACGMPINPSSMAGHITPLRCILSETLKIVRVKPSLILRPRSRP